jgi:hypothetical protein
MQVKSAHQLAQLIVYMVDNAQERFIVLAEELMRLLPELALIGYRIYNLLDGEVSCASRPIAEAIIHHLLQGTAADWSPRSGPVLSP